MILRIQLSFHYRLENVGDSTAVSIYAFLYAKMQHTQEKKLLYAHLIPQYNYSIGVGRAVFMKSTNVVYQMLKKIGISSVYDVNLLKEKPLFYIEEAQSKRQETIELIRNVYSKELRLKYLKELLTE